MDKNFTGFTPLTSYKSNFITKISNSTDYDQNRAISELIDNSIGAGAKNITITVDLRKKILTVLDDGVGMDEIEIVNDYLHIGESGTKNDSMAPGAFGAGGKAGPFYLMNYKEGSIEMRTKKEGKDLYYMVLNKANEPSLYEGGEVSFKYPEPYKSLNGTMNHGTEIKVKHNMDINVNELASMIQTKYCWRMKESGIKIYLHVPEITDNPILLKGEDPLYRNNKFLKDAGTKIDKAQFKIQLPDNPEKTYIINITVANFHTELPNDQCSVFDGGDPVLPQKAIEDAFNIKYYRPRNGIKTANRSGFYIKTGGVYFSTGQNIDSLMGGTQHASCNGLRIEMDIPKELWKIIGMTYNKSDKFTKFAEIPYFYKTFKVQQLDGKTVDELDKDCIYAYLSDVISNFKEYSDSNRKEQKKKGKTIVSLIKDSLSRRSINMDDFNFQVVKDKFFTEDFISKDGDEIVFNMSRAGKVNLPDEENAMFLEPVIALLAKTTTAEACKSIVKSLNSTYNEK